MAEQSSGLSWQVLTHVHKERSADWYWALGLFAVLGSGISIYFNNILLVFILVIGAACIGFLTARGPREHNVHVDNRGVTVDGTLYPYTSIHSFSVGGHEGQAQSLVLSVSSLLMPHITLPLEGMSPDVVRMTMRRYCKEEVYQPRIIDSLAEIAGL